MFDLNWGEIKKAGVSYTIWQEMQLCIESVDQHRNNLEIYYFYILSEKYKKSAF